MKKGYQVIEPEQLDALLVRTFEYDDFTISILHWLVQQLHIELKDQLSGIEIEVIKIVHHTPDNKYPGLGIHYQDSTDSRDLGPLVEATINHILRERSINDLIEYISNSGIDWNAVTIKIMNG